MEFTLLGAAALAVGVMWLWTTRDPALDEFTDPFGTLLGAAMVGLLVGRITAMITTGTSPFSVDIILVRGGVSTIGASLAALAWLGWSVRRNAGRVDALAPAALAGLASWHLSCIVRGSCLGAASDLPWAWSLAGSPVDRHPVEVYAGLILGVGTVVVTAVRGRGLRTGVTTMTAIGVAGLARFVTEPLRLTLGELAWFYGIAGAFGLLGAVWLYVRTDQDR